MMKTLFYGLLLLAVISCKAQQILPLNSSALQSPNNSYFKDLNNELESFVGNWQADYQNRTIKLSISKQLQAPLNVLFGKNLYQDMLLVRYEVKSNGIIYQNSLNKDFSTDIKFKIKSTGTEDNGNTAILVFAGGNCGIGMGDIIFRKINATQFYWSYFPKTVRMNEINCPPNQDFTIYLPETENLIFTKQ
ncbi:DUF6705 family protein [Chryseobacterium sp. MFBS3-17]|uniref:DUF6705 family protein n=1 Tax=Chryseobacterium sp. MFBS3-17 TaxID=2886689 RepID=UPI001D0E202C|nr:DUF6705 family protein [Chryseobacterium sp. MFBS3-17]MCC2590574.1 hypothetical protein [Chryseobacterium sp. MFBS3-17]